MILTNIIRLSYKTHYLYLHWTLSQAMLFLFLFLHRTKKMSTYTYIICISDLLYLNKKIPSSYCSLLHSLLFPKETKTDIKKLNIKMIFPNINEDILSKL